MYFKGESNLGKQCVECGIAEPAGEGKLECVKYRKIFAAGENFLNGCHYFSEKTFEDGEMLSPLEHLLIKEQEINSRHMKGPV